MILQYENNFPRSINLAFTEILKPLIWITFVFMHFLF